MKKIILALMFLTITPQSVWAAICPFGKEPKTTCEIMVCWQQGFPSSAGCRPAKKEFIKRILKRKNPWPILPECPCTNVPAWVIPDKEASFGFKSDAQMTPISSKQYAQAINYNEKPAYTTNCPRSNFSLNGVNCTMRTEDSVTSVTTRRVSKKYKKERKRIYEFRTQTRPTTPGGVSSETRIRIRNGQPISCLTYKGGALVSSDCGGYGETPTVTPTPQPTDPTPGDVTPRRPIQSDLLVFPQ